MQKIEKGKIKKKLGWSKHTPGLLLRLFPADQGGV
jgi:hypothetical protein